MNPRVAAALALLLLLALAFQGSRGLYSPDEGRYSGVALQMLESGDWIHPRLHPEHPHYTKPPLTYWAIAASVGTFGRHEWAVRLPSALAYAFTTLLVLAMGRTVVPRRPWLPAVIYASALLPLQGANAVTTDDLLALAEATYCLAFVRARAAALADEPRARWLALLGFGAGLAFLTKGPPGLLPLLAMLLFAATARGEPRPRAYLSAAGLALFALVGVGWYVVVALGRPELVRYFFVEEVWNRVSSTEMHRNAQWYGGILVYVPTLVLGLLPWSFFAAAPAWRFARAPREALARLRGNNDALLLACWIVLPLAVFFVARSRLPLYVLPLFAPIALALARRLAAVEPRAWHGAALAAWLAAMLGVRYYAAARGAEEDDRRLATQIAALALDRIDEVVFVDTAARYGLIFYLRTEVEHINVMPEPGDTTTQDIPGELAEREGCQLFLVPHKKTAAFEAALAGAPIHGAGTVANFTAYLDAAACAKRR